MTSSSTPVDNQLLAALPDAVLQAWLPCLETVDLALGQVLHEGISAPGHLFFPTTAIVAPLLVLRSGDTAAMAVIGREGMVGTSALIEEWSMPSRKVVQCAGQAVRLNAPAPSGHAASGRRAEWANLKGRVRELERLVAFLLAEKSSANKK